MNASHAVKTHATFRSDLKLAVHRLVADQTGERAVPRIPAEGGGGVPGAARSGGASTA